jgi:hypothetical protein
MCRDFLFAQKCKEAQGSESVVMKHATWPKLIGYGLDMSIHRLKWVPKNAAKSTGMWSRKEMTLEFSSPDVR